MMDFKRQLASALVLNVVLKVFTFLLTSGVTRQLAPNENGVNFSFQLYFNTVLFLARESVRSVNARHNLREKSGSGGAALKVMNCAAISLPLGLLVVLVLELLHGFRITLFPSLAALANVGSVSAASAEAQGPGMDGGTLGLPEVVQVISVIAALSIEPCLAVAQSLDNVRTVVTSEFWALLARLTATISILWWYGSLSGHPWITRMCFSVANLSDALATVAYFLCLWNAPNQERGRKAAGGSGCEGDEDGEAATSMYQVRVIAARVLWGDTVQTTTSARSYPLRECLPWCYLSLHSMHDVLLREFRLFLQFFRESCLRLLLTEGEHFALAAMGSAAAVGQYSVVTNLGSLIVRLVFRVWETACFARWSRDIAAGRMADASVLLFVMLRVSLYFGAVAILLGPPLAELVLLRLFTRRWATAETVRALQLYCYQLPLMGWYGLLDAFVRATASPRVLRLAQQVLVVQAAVYVAFCFAALRLHWVGDPVAGLIVANGISTGLRCATSLWMIIKTPGRPQQESRRFEVQLRDFSAVFDSRIATVWFLLFGCTRMLLPFISLTTSGVVSVVLFFPLFAASVLRWDPETRVVVKALVLSSKRSGE